MNILDNLFINFYKLYYSKRKDDSDDAIWNAWFGVFGVICLIIAGLFFYALSIFSFSTPNLSRYGYWERRIIVGIILIPVYFWVRHYFKCDTKSRE